MPDTLPQDKAAAAKICADYALRSLLLEAWFGPKPGLVDRFSSNSHSDMDYKLFRRSAFALRPWFEAIFTEAAEKARFELRFLFTRYLRPLGLEAETEMLRLTGGVNTHRGALFTIGLLGSAHAVLRARGEWLSSDTVRNCAASMVHGISGELNMAAAPSGPGARGEAEAGFPTVMAALRQLGTSDFQSLENLSFGLVQEPCSGLEPGILDYDLIKVLVSVSARMEDSNIIRRSGKEVLNTYRLLSEELDRRAGWIDKVWREEYYRLCVFTLKNRISPGGAADMVSAALFLRFLEKNEQMRAEDSREYSVLPIVKTEI